MSKKLIIVVMAGVLVIGGGIAGALAFGLFGSHHKSSGVRSPKPSPPPKLAYVQVKELTLRLADTDTEHYLKISPVVAVPLIDQDAVTEKLAIVRDRIVSVASARTSADLLKPEGQVKLKQDLMAALKKDFPDSLTDIYLSDYLVE
ncbi:MAG: flagellar basal body-associated protein FliL [Candidatus Binataceae bacterium]